MDGRRHQTNTEVSTYTPAPASWSSSSPQATPTRFMRQYIRLRSGVVSCAVVYGEDVSRCARHRDRCTHKAHVEISHTRENTYIRPIDR